MHGREWEGLAKVSAPSTRDAPAAAGGGAAAARSANLFFCAFGRSAQSGRRSRLEPSAWCL